MNLVIVSSSKLLSKISGILPPSEWKIILPSVYSEIWQSPAGDVPLNTIKSFIARFSGIYVEEGMTFESMVTIQHAIRSLSIEEYHICDFDGEGGYVEAIAQARYIDKNHANAKFAQYEIDNIFITKLSKAIKRYAIASRTEKFEKSSKGDIRAMISKWHKELSSFFILPHSLAALYWIIKAERTIEAHDPRKIHRIWVQYNHNGIEFSAPLTTVYTDDIIQERDDALLYLRDPANHHTVKYFQREQKEVKPHHKPVVLSFLQSKMFYLYLFPIEYTTKIAKRLHKAGLLTDPMSGSTYIPYTTSIEIIRMLNERYGDEYVQQNIRETKDEYNGATAILPTRFEKQYYPENVEGTQEFASMAFESSKMKKDALLLYGLVFAITEWWQMKDAIYDTSTLEISCGNSNKQLNIKANRLADIYDPIKKGNVPQKCWKSVHKDLLDALSATSQEPDEDSFITALPECRFQDRLRPISVETSPITPKRPPRYGAGRFNTQILGGKGIGNAESFHIIQNNLVSSGAVVLSNSMLHPQEIAREAVEWCEKYAPILIDELNIHEYWARLDSIRFNGEDPNAFIEEYRFMINEFLKESGHEDDDNRPPSEGMIKLAKALAIQKNIRIDKPELFFTDSQAVKRFIDTHAAEQQMSEQDRLMKCPICRQGYVFEKVYTDSVNRNSSIYYACEHGNCFRIFDSKIDEFFKHKGRDFSKEERLEALTNIAGKQHLKSKGYLFTDLIGSNQKPYKAKIAIDSYGEGQGKRYTLKIESFVK